MLGYLEPSVYRAGALAASPVHAQHTKECFKKKPETEIPFLKAVFSFLLSASRITVKGMSIIIRFGQ